MSYGIATAYGQTYRSIYPAGSTTDVVGPRSSQGDTSARKLMLAIPILAVAGYAVYAGLDAAKMKKQARAWR